MCKIAFLTVLSGLLAAAHAKELSVLMIGNSYTQGSKAMLQGFADADPDCKMIRGDAQQGGIGVEQHYASRTNLYPYSSNSLESLLNSRAWDVIVIQNNSLRGTTTLDKNNTFQTGSKNLCDYLRSKQPDAQFCWFMTWAKRPGHGSYAGSGLDLDSYTEELRVNYMKRAEENGGIVAPVGLAWQAAYAERPYNPNDKETSFSLHVDDGSHGNVAGYYLTAAVLFETIFNTSCVGNSYLPETLSKEDAAFLQRIAHETVAGFQ
jgi:hypothetical protein